jgi:parallel beta-helix repeat protein
LERKNIILIICVFTALIAGIVSTYCLTQIYYRIPTDGVVVTPPKEADYTIRKSGSTIMAINSTGQVEFSGTDATTVIQYAIDAVGAVSSSTNPKKIFIEDGEYDLTMNTVAQGNGEVSALWMWYYSYITIEGQSWNTILKTNDGPYNAIYFQGGWSGNPKNIGCRIANLQIDGGAPAPAPEWTAYTEKNGIQTRMTEYSVFENLYIHNFGRTGLYNTWYSNHNIIRNCFFELNNRYGASYTSSHSGHVYNNRYKENARGQNWDATHGPADNTIIENNIFENNIDIDLFAVGDISLNAPLKNGIVRNNVIISKATWSAIKITYATENVVFRNNTITYSGSSSEEAIFVTDWSADVTIEDNQITTTTGANGIVVDGTSSSVVRNNRFNVTNYGIDLNNADAISVIDNTFAGTNGVRVLDSSVTNTLIEGNDFTQVTGTKILDNGVGTIIGDNLGYP